jgi:hypothetical protein
MPVYQPLKSPLFKCPNWGSDISSPNRLLDYSPLFSFHSHWSHFILFFYTFVKLRRPHPSTGTELGKQPPTSSKGATLPISLLGEFKFKGFRRTVRYN